MAKTLVDALPVEYQKFKETVGNIANLLFQSRLFPKEHPSVEKATSDAFVHLDTLLQQKNSVIFKFMDGFICHLNFQINLHDTNKRAVSLFRETCNRLSIGEIEFFSGVRKEELIAFASILASVGKKERSGDIALSWSVIEHIKIRHHSGIDQFKTQSAPSSRDTNRQETVSKQLMPVAQEKDAVKADSKMGEIVSGVLEHMEKISSQEGRRAGRRIIEIVETEGRNASSILLLNSLRNYDEYTFQHSVNVAVISTAISRYLGYDDDSQGGVGLAALMHDIGKFYVPKQIIHKTGQLTPSEWQVMKKHPSDGERILREEGVNRLSRLVAYEHHMRFDLHGYPLPKDEDYELVEVSHIIRIADSYDALTTKRPYRRQISPYEAIKLMSSSRGSEFHPGLFDIFLHVLGNIPIGSVLKLTTGETVLVVDINESQGNLPRVRVLEDASGMKVEEKVIIDLNDLQDMQKSGARIIAGIVDQQFRDVDIGNYLVD